jgi:long-chain acyl-CoA synthetase
MTTAVASPIPALLDARLAATGGDRPFVVGAGGELRYRALADRIARLTTLFGELGLGVGDRVVIVSSDDIATITLFMALLRNGLTAVLLNPEARPDELARLVEAADARALFIDRGHAAWQLPEALTAGRARVAIRPGADAEGWWARWTRRAAGDAYPDLLAQRAPGAAPGGIPAATVAYILFTSGTTSRPKGVQITHANLAAQMATFIRHYGFDARLRLYNALPLYHADGLTQGATVAFWAGGTLLRPVPMRVNLVGELLDACYRARATHLVAVPSMLALLMDLPAQYRTALKQDAFRFAISTAAHLDAGLWERFEQAYGVRVVNVYGLTETVCETSYCGPDDATRRLGTVGKAVDAELRTVDDEGRPTAPGTPGELQVRGPHVMAGYFRMPAETAVAFDGEWFRTGDLATIDAEGFVRIVGRKKDLIITADINVYPEDVTGTLRRMPGIVDAVTFGMPSERWGEEVVSCVILTRGSDLTEQRIAEWFLEHASPEKLPRQIHIFEEFPRGPAGKVIAAEIRRLVEERRSGKREAPRSGGVEARVYAVAAAAFKRDAAALHARSSPEDTDGWTSLAHVELLIGLEQEFGIELAPADVMRIRTLGDAAALVAEALAAKR